MLHLNFLLITSVFLPIQSYRDLKNIEIEVALEIFKELNIGHCILVVENLHSMILNHKEVYDDGKFMAHIQPEDLKLFFNNNLNYYIRMGFVISTDEINILHNLFEKYPFKVAQFTWLIFGNESIGHKITIPYNCDFFTVEFVNETEYLVKEIYYVKSSGPFTVNFGVWSNSSGLVLNKKFNDERKNMKGATIIRGDNNGYKICNDFVIEIKHREMWVEFAKQLNYTLLVVNDHLYNESTDPLAPDGSPCCIAQHALNYFPDAVFPTCLIPLYMIIKFENDLGEGWKAYFKPFDNELWWFILGFLVISITTFMIIGYFTESIFYINPFAVFYSFCDQDGIDLSNEKLISLSSCIAYMMPFIVATVIVPAYSAAILAKLTIQLPVVPFTDLQTFADDGTYRLGALNNTFVIKYFSRSEHPLVSKIYHQMWINKKEYPNRNIEAMKKICEEKKLALIPMELPYYERNPFCKTLRIEKLMLHIYCGFRMRYGSPFKNIFNKLAINFFSSGLRWRVDGVYIIKRMPEDDEFEPIKFAQILPIINLIPLGIFLSIISLLIEIFIRNKKKTKFR